MRCEDCVHEKVCEGFSNCESEGLCELKRPNGEWKREPNGYLATRKCSNCGFDGNQLWHFCPNCGAKMRREGE